MNVEDASAPVPQHWERPLRVAPGYWKQQLATKYLVIAGRGDVEALRRLLAEHPHVLNKRGPHNRTLLWEATRRGKLAAVRWLVEHGAEVDATGSYNSESQVQITPYCAAIYYHHADIAAYLRSKGAPLDIFRAAFVGDLAHVSQALAADPALLDAEDPYDSIYFVPLLAFAVAGGQAAMADFLLQRGAAVAPYSAQLLHLAGRAGRLDLVKLLLTHGADARAVDGGIFVAVADLAIIRYLLSQGASANRPGKNRLPPLLYLVRGDKGEHPEKVQLLLEHGAAVDATDAKGRTALHYAAAAGYLRVISVLLDHGASLAAKDHQGDTALSLARREGKTAVAKLLTHS